MADGVTSIGDFSFFYCLQLSSITISDSLVSIGNQAFADCDKLSEIKWHNKIYTSLGGFYTDFNAINVAEND